MVKHNCDTCRFRAQYDQNSRSLLGRLWRWHVNWCPGWKSYMAKLSEQEKSKLVKRYNFIS